MQFALYISLHLKELILAALPLSFKEAQSYKYQELHH